MQLGNRARFNQLPSVKKLMCKFDLIDEARFNAKYGQIGDSVEWYMSAPLAHGFTFAESLQIAKQRYAIALAQMGTLNMSVEQEKEFKKL